SYEIEDNESYLQKALPDVSLTLKPNDNELCCEIKYLPVTILKVNALRVECNITTGA
ncbi:hypothetical protein PV325_011124, partial [Microctonus aethiopoides]